MAKFNRAWIIDDDELFVIVAKANLKELDFADKITDFSDGRDALKFFEENPEVDHPEVIFLDVNMNMMDGWELLDALKPLGVLDDIKVYITTSSIDPSDFEKAKNNPYVESFISKPFNEQELKQIVP